MLASIRRCCWKQVRLGKGAPDVQQKGVIDPAFASRFAALAGQNQEKTFACPAVGCGRTLIAVSRAMIAGIWVVAFPQECQQ